MLTRQKLLLRILANAGGNCTKLQLIKLSFLLATEGRSEQLKTFYEFVPYLYGPYSFTLNHEIDHLVRSGCIKLPEENDIELTPHGQKVATFKNDPRLGRDFELLESNYGKLSLSKLVDQVYEKYPWFTANSKAPHKRKASITPASCANYTIGYQSFQVDGLLNRLLEFGITRLIDTRSNPISRRYGYHRSTLSRLCHNVGLEYEHIAELGIPSSWRQELVSDDAYRALFDRYDSEILSNQKKIVSQVAVGMTTVPTALLCMETDATHCHRTRLANQLKVLNKLPLIELGEKHAAATL